jgi:glycosyltransferase involved in cell wall biosynthesis
MAKLISELSVFLPAYNEEGNVEKTVTATKSVISKIAKKWEIIIVDDGSKDRTGKIADKLSAASGGKILTVHNKPNRGYGGALKSGFEASKYEWIAFMDIDGQFDFSEITTFIKKQRETKADLVLGIRKKRADSFIRKVYTLIWSVVLPRIMFGMNVTDYSCGFKMIRKKVYQKVQPLLGEEKVTQIEMLVKAQRLGYKFTEVKVNHYPREFGKQTGANLKVIAKSIVDLSKLWWVLR